MDSTKKHQTAEYQSHVVLEVLNPWNPEKPRFWVHEEPGKADERTSAASIQEQCMIENFCDIVRSGELDPAWPKISIANQRICDALAESARAASIVDVV